MHFARVEESQLDGIDFSFPPEPLFNKNLLDGEKVANPKIYIGCPRWGVKEWVGKIYPTAIKEANFLKEYVNHYNAIEFNATHYKLYAPADIEKWAAKTGDKDFLFCPKIYKDITHEGVLTSKQTLTNTFLESVRHFGEHLGPVFFQLSEKFSAARKTELFTYLELLPADLPLFFEVRHPDWFDGDIPTELFTKLKALKIGSVITDVAGRRDCCHMHLTTPKTFVRFAGNSLHPTDYARIDNWVNQIRHWLENGLQELYFFIHMPDDIFAPELSVYFIDKLNETCGLQLKKPVFVPVLF
jgi:uncharacterized protein YecE (DUF72 family)